MYKKRKKNNKVKRKKEQTKRRCIDHESIINISKIYLCSLSNNTISIVFKVGFLIINDMELDS